MPNLFQVGATTAVQVPADTVRPRRITHAGGGTTLYYKSSSDVSTSSSDGSLTVGQSLDALKTEWLIGSAEVRCITEALPTGIETAVAAGAGFHTWEAPTATSGTDTANADTALFVASVFVPVNMVATGVKYLVGSVGGTTKMIAQLNDANGTLLANSTLTSSGTTAGTAAQVQTMAFVTATPIKGPALYYIGITGNGTTSKLRTIPAHTQTGVYTAQLVQTTVTPAAIAPPTSFTADVGPVAHLYT